MNLPVVMFHHIADNPHPSLKGWTISTKQFNLFLDCITERGYETITFETINLMGANVNLRKKIIITFDDCPASLFDHAVPELLKREMKAVFFIPTAQIGGINSWDVEEQGFEPTRLMSADQLQYLSANGMEIGSHGDNHKRPELNHKISENETHQSKAILTALLGKKIISFSYPYGQIPKHYPALLKSAGYQFATGIYTPFQTQLSLRRFGIHESDTKQSMSFKLGHIYRGLRFISDPLLQLYNLIRV